MNVSEKIVLVNRSHHPSPTAGRLLDEQGLSYNLVKNWLGLCDGLHQDICPPSSAARLARPHASQTLRVVNVRDDCLADIPWTEQYIALSYVWGNAQPPRLMRADLQALYAVGSLTSLRDSIPNTIRDVMTLTIELGLRYLWFDSLCLVQDDPADLMTSIMNMDLVYESAYVTVIAANGNGADCGLPGVGRTPRQCKQHTEILKPGLELMRVLLLDKHLDKSVWASRGWTMQEHYLSRRTISFVNGQAYFRCRQRLWCEELWTDQDPEFQDMDEWMEDLGSVVQDSMDLTEDIATAYSYLFQAIERFQERNLSNQEDAINAMTGIFQRFAHRSDCSIFEGLPMDIIPVALIFLHLGAGETHRRNAFPSWSWAGWIGNPEWTAFNALHFYQRPEEIDEALSMTLASCQTYNHSEREEEADDLIWMPEDSTLKATCRDLSIPDPGSIELSGVQFYNITKPRPYGMLQMTTISIMMRAKALSARVWIVCDREDHECGYLYNDVEMEQPQNQPLLMLLLSKCYNAARPNRDSIRNRLHDMHNVGEVFWVMLLVAMEDGVYERRGIGQVLQNCISHSFEPGPRWEKVVLG